MEYKIVIDPGHGGTDSGNVGNGLVEKDYALLISNYMKERFDALGIPNAITRNTDRTVSDSERINIIKSAFGSNNDVIVISNHLSNNAASGGEIVYALRNTDNLASKLANRIEASGGVINKYYQLRDPNNTPKDYYPIIRDTGNNQTVMIFYGSVGNSTDANKIKNNYLAYAEAVVKAVADYIGAKYIPVGDNNYVVKKGDTLYKIANSYGISVDALKKANNLTSNLLNIGQVLTIPGGSKKTYVVKKGDTLYKIANSYGVSVEDLKKANNLTSNLLNIGQILTIPGDSKKTYVVKKGDTLYKIANSYGVSVNALKKANNLTSNLLSIGQVLTIPA